MRSGGSGNQPNNVYLMVAGFFGGVALYPLTDLIIGDGAALSWAFVAVGVVGATVALVAARRNG